MDLPSFIFGILSSISASMILLYMQNKTSLLNFLN